MLVSTDFDDWTLLVRFSNSPMEILKWWPVSTGSFQWVLEECQKVAAAHANTLDCKLVNRHTGVEYSQDALAAIGAL